jgi:hypothetical protein
VKVQEIRRRRHGLRRSLRRLGGRLYRRLEPSFIVERGPGWTSYRGERTVLLQRGADAPRRGIYLRGACDVPSLFTLAPMVIDDLYGSLTIHISGKGVSQARSDLLLQTLSGVSKDFTDELGARFKLHPESFAPTLFEPSFSVPGLPGSAAFPKSVVVLSVLPDLTRSVYRHRRSGYLIDPGTAWLNNLASALSNLSMATWFRETFESLGRISVGQFAENYRQLIPAIKRETGAHVLVFNSLEIEPFDPTHNYSLRNLASASRRRRFNIALTELAQELDFHVVDVDRVLKEQGVDRQVDFSHFPVDRMRAVARDAYGILRDLGVL